MEEDVCIEVQSPLENLNNYFSQPKGSVFEDEADQTVVVQEVMDIVNVQLAASFSTNTQSFLVEQTSMVFESMQEEIVRIEDNILELVGESDDPIGVVSEGIQEALFMTNVDEEEVTLAVDEAISEDPFYAQLFEAQAIQTRHEVIAKINKVVATFENLMTILDEQVQKNGEDDAVNTQSREITTIKVSKATSFTLTVNSHFPSGLPVSGNLGTSETFDEENQGQPVTPISIQLDSTQRKRNAKQPFLAVLAENPYRGADSKHMKNPVVVIKNYDGKMQYTQGQWLNEPVMSISDFAPIHVMRFQVADSSQAQTDYTINFETIPAAVNSLVLDVWIAYNQYPIPDDNQFYEKMTLPSTSGDSIFSATASDCPPYLNEGGDECQGDLMGIYLSAKEVEVCKHRGNGKCTIFIAFKVNSVISALNKIDVHLSGHSCSNLNPDNALKWTNTDCTVSPLSSREVSVCDCAVSEKATYSTSFLIPPKLLLSKIDVGCISCVSEIMFFLIFIMTLSGFMLAMIKRQSRKDLKSIVLVDSRNERGFEYIVVVETQLGHIPNPSDIVYLSPVKKQPSREWLKELEKDDFFTSIKSNTKCSLWNRVWKLKPIDHMVFDSGSRFQFVCSADEILDDIVDCVVWIPFQGTQN